MLIVEAAPSEGHEVLSEPVVRVPEVVDPVLCSAGTWRTARSYQGRNVRQELSYGGVRMMYASHATRP
jgi:predicted RNA-binding protein with PUA-like domain